MAKYRKKPVVIEATQWWKNGDHPEDASLPVEGESGTFLSEGLVVRRFIRPDVPEDQPCRQCSNSMKHHGWVDTLEGGHIVCPGDFIITGIAGEKYPCKANVFDLTYDPMPEIEGRV